MSHTPHQRGVIRRYYEHRDDIMVQKLTEIVSNLYLETDPKKKERLWARVERALVALKVTRGEIDRIMSEKDPARLAKTVERLF